VRCARKPEILDEDEYNNWYVLFVTTGKEFLVKNIIERYTGNTIRTIVFKKEILHRKKGQKIKVTNALFAGYVFIHEEINTALDISKKYLCTEPVRPIAINRKPCKVRQDEMMFLLSCADNNGIFKLSRGKRHNKAIYIIDGALKNMQGNIVWIDEKRNRVKVEVSLFQRKIKVNLGIDIIQFAL
jgi:transcription antitermination factor NusG